MHLKGINTEQFKAIYNYFAQFGVREVQINANHPDFDLAEFVREYLSGIGGNPTNEQLYDEFNARFKDALGLPEDYGVRTVEVLPEVGKEYEFSMNNKEWSLPDGIKPIESEVPLTGTMVFTNQLTGKLTLSNQLTPKPFPTYEEFMDWVYKDAYQKDIYQNIYSYFAQFGLREVFPEVNKQYEFSMDGKDWRTGMLISYAFKGLFEHNYALYIRPIQPSRLEQLKARRSELSRDELLELVTLMENGK